MFCKILISSLNLWGLPPGKSTNICKSKCKQRREDNFEKELERREKCQTLLHKIAIYLLSFSIWAISILSFQSRIWIFLDLLPAILALERGCVQRDHIMAYGDLKIICASLCLSFIFCILNVHFTVPQFTSSEKQSPHFFKTKWKMWSNSPLNKNRSCSLMKKNKLVKTSNNLSSNFFCLNIHVN